MNTDETVQPTIADDVSKPARRPGGFATLSPERRREISRAGGKAVHARGTAHEFSSEEAKAAGRKGGAATHAKRAAARMSR